MFQSALQYRLLNLDLPTEKFLKSKLCIIDEFKLDKDFVEAQAFAYLAIRSLKKLPISFPGTTGVSHPRTGGKITNYR